ncbi:MAG: response regulator [Acetobacteraceae bacterium]
MQCCSMQCCWTWMMPRKGGIEVLEAIAQRDRLEATPVIMISAATELDTVVRCLELGAEDYLPKPFNPVLLRARLASVLEKSRLRAEVRRQLGRMEAELAEARRQQLSMVPSEFPSTADGMAVDVHAVMHPAREGGRRSLRLLRARCPDAVHCGGRRYRTRECRRRCSWHARAACCGRRPLHFMAATGRHPTPAEIAGVMNAELLQEQSALHVRHAVLRFPRSGGWQCCATSMPDTCGRSCCMPDSRPSSLPVPTIRRSA